MTDKTIKFIEKALEIHGNKYDYSKVNYIGSKKKINIICYTHGEFEQRVDTHLSGQNCKLCNINNNINNNRIEFIENSKKIYGDKYDYSKSKYINSNTLITIICKQHGKFKQKPINHLRGSECIKCSIISKSINKTLQFINEAKKIHGDRYDYTFVEYINCKLEIKIICNVHGEFLQTPDCHLSKGCLKCSTVCNKYNFIEKAIKIHGNKYDYSLVEYIHSKLEIKIICNIHGEFLQIPDKHINSKQGCMKCAGHYKLTVDTFIEKSNIKHGNRYDYSKINYKNCDTKVQIICKKHGEFLQTPYNHYNGANCPNCIVSNYSQKSILWLNFMQKYYNINIIHAENINEYIIKNIGKADGYCKENNTIYEFHGDFWHGNPKLYNPNDINKRNNKIFGELYQKTIERETKIKMLGYNLVIMWVATSNPKLDIS